MKIAYMLTTYPCPSETFIEGEIQTLRKLGFEITIFAASSSMMPDMSIITRDVCYKPKFFSKEVFKSIFFLMTNFPLSSLRFISIFFRFLISCPSDAMLLARNIHTICFFAHQIQKFNITHIHSCFLSWPACVSLAVSKIVKKPFSTAAHARDVYVESGAMKLKLSCVKFLVCCSNQSLDFIKNKVPFQYYKKMYLNYHGINDKVLSTKSNKIRNEPFFTILGVGRLVEKKGFSNLVKAFADISNNTSQYRLLVVGDGPEWRNLKKLAEKLNIQKNCNFIGWLDHCRTLELIKRANVLVVPSIIDNDGDRDGIPNVILEAFSLQTPVIASALDGISEVVKNEETGLLVEPGNTDQLKYAIERICYDKVLSSNIVNNAFLVANRDFNSINNCRRLKTIFEYVS